MQKKSMTEERQKSNKRTIENNGLLERVLVAIIISVTNTRCFFNTMNNWEVNRWKVVSNLYEQ